MKIPQAQNYLDSKGKEYYQRICEHLDSADYLQDVDSLGLSMMAQCLRDFYEAAEEVNANGSWQITANGYSQKSGYFTVMSDCYNTFYKLSSLFGMTPKAREALTRFKDVKQKEDKFDQI